MQIPLFLDRSQPDSLTVQLAGQLRQAILQSRMAPGVRLPSTRRLAEQLTISRNTVVRAYEILIIEGYVESRPASGLYVCLQLPSGPVKNQSTQAIAADARSASMPLPRIALRAPDLVSQNGHRLAFDFFPGRPSAGQFPLKTWRRLLQSSLAHGGAVGLSQYSDPAGLMSLRSAIAGYLAATRGILADPSRIVIVSGIQEGINIAARLFLGPGTEGAVESPCYQGAAYAFEATGATLCGVPVDGDGLVPEDLPRKGAPLLYVTPSHQYPTGAILSLERRHEIIRWARGHGCHILEDDYDSDFRYEGTPLPAIAALAPDCTIYLGTFSKALGAGLRLGYMVLPSPLAAAARTAKGLLNNGNPWLDQSALAEMIRSGSFAAHVLRIRACYRKSRDSLLASLRRHFGDVDVSGASGGLHLFWTLPPGVPDSSVLEELARRVRVGVYSLAAGGACEVRASMLARRGIILGYAALQSRQIEQGIGRLSQAIDDALEALGPSIAQSSAPAVARDRASPPRAPGAHLAPNTRQQPALSARTRRRASSRWKHIAESSGPMPVISGIYRYPIKGLSAQLVSRVALQSALAFPQDRVFALARPGSPIDANVPKWAKKGLFVMLMLEEALARVNTQLDVSTLDFKIMQGNQQLLAVNLDGEGGRGAVEQFFHQLVPTLRGAPRLVHAQGGHFMDKPDNVLSLINLATVRSLEEQWGYEIDPLRFRANFYIDGAKPWEEFDWIGRDIVLGDALMRVDRRNGRCGATNVNPLTGRRDLDIPGSLRGAFGHKDLGVYLIVREGGEVAIGDSVRAPHTADIEHAFPPMAAPLDLTGRRFICRGCYYIYDESLGLPLQAIPAGTRFAGLPSDWSCPDCGTEKATFRPHVEALPR